MELEPDAGNAITAGNVGQDDIENELREFLEGETSALAATDDVAIEQMLMDWVESEWSFLRVLNFHFSFQTSGFIQKSIFNFYNPVYF